MTDTIPLRAACSRHLKRIWWPCRDGHRERITEVRRQNGGPNVWVTAGGKSWLADPDRIIYRREA